MRHGFIGYGNLIKALYKNIGRNEGETFAYCSKTNLHNEIRSFPDIPELVANSDVIWLGVKPCDLDDPNSGTSGGNYLVYNYLNLRSFPLIVYSLLFYFSNYLIPSY